uniref:Uncharacterized protein n=1 Tax=Arion vulgaris TaxID=1028688 RepID=A0A0B7BGY1_9EUPU
MNRGSKLRRQCKTHLSLQYPIQSGSSQTVHIEVMIRRRSEHIWPCSLCNEDDP